MRRCSVAGVGPVVILSSFLSSLSAVALLIEGLAQLFPLVLL